MCLVHAALNGSVKAAMDLQYPFTGRWLVQNSPANRVPSHGTQLFATSYAIDFVPLGEADRTAPVTLSTLLRPEPPERFPGFGRPGFGARGRPPGRPEPGTVLPPFVRSRLDLTAEQEKQLTELERDARTKLLKILTDEQKAIYVAGFNEALHVIKSMNQPTPQQDKQPATH